MSEKILNLSKYLSPLNVWALAFGCSVGWGAFVMPGTTFLPLAGPLGTVIGMLIGVIIMLVIGMNYHFLMNKYPDSGGTFTYTKKIFGYDHGFLSAWFLVLTYIVIIWANATALVLIARKLFGNMFQFGFYYQLAGYDVYFGETMITITALIFFGLLCIKRKSIVIKMQTLMAIILVLGVLVCFSNVMNYHEGGLASFSPMFFPGSSISSQIFSMVALAPWAFVGFESISHSTEEFNFPVKNTFRIMLISIFTGCAIYIMLTIMAIAIVPPGYGSWVFYITKLTDISNLPTFFAANASMGLMGIKVIGLTVIAAIGTGIIGNYIAASRLLYSMAKDKILPDWFSVLNENNSPKNIFIFIITISLIIPFFGRTAVSWIVDITSVGATIAYGYTSAAAYVAACESGDKKVKFTGIIGTIFSIFVGLFLLVPNLMSINTMSAESYLILVIWSILGFLFFRFIFKRDNAQRFGKSVIAWVVMLFLIFFGSTIWIRQSSNQTMESVMENITSFYMNEMDNLGIKRRRARQDMEEVFLQKQVNDISSSLLIHSTIQIILILLSLTIMFNIYSIMRKREKQAEIAKLKAEESNKAKTTFLSNMSHDIRTPMNAIIGYINLAKRDGLTLDETKNFLSKIEVSSQHLLALINDVLEMSRIESGKMELEPVDTDICKIINEVQDMFATQMESKKIEFKVSSNVKNRHVLCDKNRLNRVLLNLLSNAYKFTPEGGNISVTLMQLEDDDEKFGNYELRVKDSGIGMTKEFAAKVFEAFEREKTSTVSNIQGTGLGMAITKSIVDLMNGNIEVITAPNKGTEFIVQLKFELLDDIVEEETENDTEQDNQINFKDKKLLLVDDIEVNREIAVMILTQAGFIVDTAINGKDAVDKLEASTPGYYDAVLMDIQMPVMNGYEAAQAIRKIENYKLAHIPIIAMTANAFSEDIQAAKAAGMNAHIAKPIDVPKMMETLKLILKH